MADHKEKFLYELQTSKGLIMRNRISFVFLMSVIVFSSLGAQIVLQHEELQGSRYSVKFHNSGYPYSIHEAGGKRIIRFNVPPDEGKEAAPTLPRRDLFIALPPNTRPDINVVITQQDVIPNVLPILNPKVHRQNDSVLVYTAVTGAPPQQAINTVSYRFNGYLWVGNTYCAHITIYPYLYDEHGNQLSELKEFQIDFTGLPIGTQTSMNTVNVAPASDLVDNKQFAPGWRSAAPAYEHSRSDSWIDYSQEYLKIGVANDDVVRLPYAVLQAYGVPVGTLNPKAFKLFLKGKEVPIYVYGESDNVFDPGDYVEFLGRRNYGNGDYRTIAASGTPYHEYLDRYSDTTIYWLNWGGSFGKRVDTVITMSGSPADTTNYYDELIHKEFNYYWDFSLSGGDVRRNSPSILENATWNEGNLGVGTLPISFPVTNLYPNRPSRAFVKLQDYSSDISLNAHDLALSINAKPTVYDSGYINKYQVKVLAASFNSSALTNGANTVNIQSYPTANSINTVIRDWYELEYPRYLQAASDSIIFSYRNPVPPKFSIVAVSGLSSSAMTLYKFKIADSSIVKITNYSRNNDTLRFIDTVAAGTTYFLCNANKTKLPVVFYKKKFIDLRGPNNTADYLAITHPYFKAAAASYLSFIASTYKVTTKLIDVNDIYDEFNYGFFAAEPIRDFLQATHQYWQTPKPQYVFLIGKGTYDFYGNKSRYFGAPVLTNFVPPYGDPVSDTWYTIWDSTGALLPQMDIGRIPAKNMDEFQSYFTKHQKYVSKGYDDWNKRYLFFSGGDFTQPDQLVQSKAVNDAIINNDVVNPPIGGLIANFYKTINPITNFGPYSSSFFDNAIEQGGLFISYLGHSGTQTWDNSITDIAQLANIRDRNPLITDFGCSTGKFAEPDVLSFSELATNDVKGQAIAYIGNASLGFTSTAYTFPQVFYKKLLIDTSLSIGETHRLAKLDYFRQNGSSDVTNLFILTNTLIGDPIVKLPIPPKPNFSLTNTSLVVTPAHPTEQTDSIRINFSYNNLGKVPTDSVEIQITDEFQTKAVFSRTIKHPVPLFADSISITIPVRSMAGEHKLSIRIDPSNRFDEITKSDNSFASTIIVASSLTRSLTIAPVANQIKGDLTFLNPTVKTPDSKFIVEVAANSTFSSSQQFPVPFDTFYTKFRLDASQFGKRLWIKTKNEAQTVEGLTYSYLFGTANNYFINDSISFSRIVSSNIKIDSNRFELDTSQIVFSALSAGFSDGNTAVISKNGQNFIASNTLRGHHVVLFDAVTYDFAGYFNFDLLGAASEVTRYKAFFDTLTTKYIVIIAISDEGSINLDAQLKSSIKQLGSKYIDSVGFRDSWAIIGRKGAMPGSVPEKFSQPFTGRVLIDSVISVPKTNGTFETEPIGPVAAWKNVQIHYAKPAGGTIKISIVGIKPNAASDTLKSVSLADSTIDLSNVNAQQYPAIKVTGEFGTILGQKSPSINSIAVNYDQLAELGTNYQAVTAYLTENGTQGREIQAGDTVQQGEKVLLKYRVYNAGGVAAKKFGVQSGAFWDNNNTEALSSAVVDSLPAQAYRELSAVYNTSLGFGNRSIRITIDPDTLIRELFKDNNIFVFPIYVKKDSSKPLLPNLYISQKNIYPIVSPVTDEKDSARFVIIYGNSGAFINDSVTISIKQFYNGANVTSWTVRRKYPAELDTIYLDVPILKRAGEHQLQVDLDPVGLIVESSETDNSATYYFTVVTTDYKILQPTAFSTGAYSKMIFMNPTNSIGSANRIADLQLDTLENYSTAKTVQLVMQEFTTSYDISTLRKAGRYYWRIMQDQGGRGWTTGSFYLGDTAPYAIGQADSAGWKNDLYVHAAYTPSGAQIADTRTQIRVLSAGFSDGRTGSIEVNGINVISPVFGTGHNLIVIDTSTYAVVARMRFDISNIADESDSLTQFIASIAPGFIVSDVVVDEGANNLKQSTRDALKSIGSASIDKLTRRDSWAIIGRKGAAIGTVPELYAPQFAGPAVVETTFTRKEFKGTITTQPFGPLSKLSAFTMTGQIPNGTSVKTQFVGTLYNSAIDTIALTSGTVLSNPNIQNLKSYKEGKIIFNLQLAGQSAPSITGWKLSALPFTELAVSQQNVSVSASQVMEGQPIVFNGMIFNVSSTPAESVIVQLSINEGGFEKIVKTQKYPVVSALDSAAFSYTLSSKGEKGSHAFTLSIDPLDSLLEESKDNNVVSIPFVVQTDSLRPVLQITVNGDHVLDGDYIRQQPEIVIQYSDNNPSAITAADTGNFKIRLNNLPVYFAAGVTELIPSTTPGQAQLKWTPTLPNGENFIQIYALDVSGNSSDTTTLFVNVSTEFLLKDVYNLPNPFAGSTQFTFNILSPVTPDEVSVKIFTVAGRLIQSLSFPAKIGFNNNFWDGRDRDGDEIGNGVYFYKVIVKQAGKQTDAISKLVKMK
jgi:hypothetical protein